MDVRELSSWCQLKYCVNIMWYFFCVNVSSYMCCCIHFLVYVQFSDYTVVLYVINRMKYSVRSLSCSSFSYCKYVNFFYMVPSGMGYVLLCMNVRKLLL